MTLPRLSVSRRFRVFRVSSAPSFAFVNALLVPLNRSSLTVDICSRSRVSGPISRHSPRPFPIRPIAPTCIVHPEHQNPPAHPVSPTTPSSQTPPSSSPQPQQQSSKKPPFRIAITALALAAGLFTVTHWNFPWLTAVVDSVTTKARVLGSTRAAIVLACLNFTTVLFCFPANMGLMIAAGAILPPIYAFGALFLSKISAACVAFLLGRTLLRSRAERWLSEFPRLQNVLSRPEISSWTSVLLLRLSPFPGFVLNYFLSLTEVPFSHYIFGTVLGIAPSIANLVLIGDAAKGVGQQVASGAQFSAWLAPTLKLAMVASMILVMVQVTKFVATAFDEQSPPPQSSTKNAVNASLHSTSQSDSSPRNEFDLYDENEKRDSTPVPSQKGKHVVSEPVHCKHALHDSNPN